MNKFDELTQRVIEWSEGFDLYDNSREMKQVSKAFEEFSELVDSIDDNVFYAGGNDYEVKDAIGDILVCLTNAEYLRDGEYYYPNELEEIAAGIACGDYTYARESISDLCKKLNLDINECFEMAVETIEKRKLLMVNGKAVKWENMTDEQRELWESRNG